jgi:hypothetical protein
MRHRLTHSHYDYAGTASTTDAAAVSVSTLTAAAEVRGPCRSGIAPNVYRPAARSGVAVPCAAAATSGGSSPSNGRTAPVTPSTAGGAGPAAADCASTTAAAAAAVADIDTSTAVKPLACLT